MKNSVGGKILIAIICIILFPILLVYSCAMSYDKRKGRR